MELTTTPMTSGRGIRFTIFSYGDRRTDRAWQPRFMTASEHITGLAWLLQPGLSKEKAKQ
jgi:hypothetical protein